MQFPQARDGQPLRISDSTLKFTFFPMRRTTRRWGLNAMIYASDPWATIHDSVAAATSPDQASAELFLRQAREFYRAADASGTPEARPLLYYYGFMNLTKALAIVRNRPNIVGKALHGVAHDGNFGHTVSTAQLQVQAGTPNSVSILDELHHALTGQPVPVANVKVADLVIHSVVGHRLWAHGLDRRERFLAIDSVQILHDDAAKRIWSTITVPTDLLMRRGWSATRAITLSHLAPDFRIVRGGAGLRVFEQAVPVDYAARAADRVMDVVGATRIQLWQTVTSSHPYRRYYLYLSQANESRLPQIVAAYMLLFWLGSLTRYRPTELLVSLNGTLGGFFREFLATQPPQLLYMLASEFRQQDVSRAAVV